jgi:hypothetical protein
MYSNRVDVVNAFQMGGEPLAPLNHPLDAAASFPVHQLNRSGVDPTTEHYKGERRAGDECSLTPFFSLPLVHYLAAVGAPAIPCQNLTCLIQRNHGLSIHCNQHSATLNSRAIELGLLPAVPRFA